MFSSFFLLSGTSLGLYFKPKTVSILCLSQAKLTLMYQHFYPMLYCFSVIVVHRLQPEVQPEVVVVKTL